jgi:flagellar biosynthetic protein FliR
VPLAFDAAWVMQVLLAACRVAPLFVMAPVFGSVMAPPLVRAILIVALAAAIVSASGTGPVQAPTTLAQLLAAAAGEVVIGAALAFGIAAAFAAFLFAGRLLDFQFGFGIANLVDPVTRAQAPLLGTGLQLLAVTIFFLVDGHLHLVRALALSLQQVPPGGFGGGLDFGLVAAQFGLMFSLGLTIAAPALFAVLLLDIGFAAMARSMPQMNVFIVSIPFKIALGLLVLSLSMRYLSGAIGKAFDAVFRYWTGVLA